MAPTIRPFDLTDFSPVPQYATIAATTSGNTPVRAAVAGKKIRVLHAYAKANGAVTVKFQSATTDITGSANLSAAGDDYKPGGSLAGLFETAAGEALNVNLSAIVTVGGHVTYVLVD